MNRQHNYNINFLNDFYIFTNNRLQESIELFRNQTNIINNYQITLDTIATRLLLDNYNFNRNIRNSNNNTNTNTNIPLHSNVSRLRNPRNNNNISPISPPPTPPRVISRNNLPPFLNNIRPPSNIPHPIHRNNNYVESDNDEVEAEAEEEVLLSETPRQNIPTLSDIRRNTRTISFNHSEHTQTVCPIEHTSFNQGDIVTQIIHCGHIFYQEAISTWFERDSRCPLCRYNISPITNNQNNQNNQNSIDTFRQTVDNIIRNTLQSDNIPSPTVNTHIDNSGNTIRTLDYRLN